MADSEQQDSIAFLLADILRELRRSIGGSGSAPPREIMSIPQAAEYLGQSKDTLRDWVRLRKIPYCKINGTIKFRKSRLERWIDQHEIAMME